MKRRTVLLLAITPLVIFVICLLAAMFINGNASVFSWPSGDRGGVIFCSLFGATLAMTLIAALSESPSK